MSESGPEETEEPVTKRVRICKVPDCPQYNVPVPMPPGYRDGDHYNANHSGDRDPRFRRQSG